MTLSKFCASRENSASSEINYLLLGLIFMLKLKQPEDFKFDTMCVARPANVKPFPLGDREDKREGLHQYFIQIQIAKQSCFFYSP